MAVHNLIGSQKYRTRSVAGTFFGTVVVPDAALVITADMPTFIKMTPTAARNIDLPAAADGLTFLITNGAAATFALTVRLTGAGATVGTVAAAKSALFYCIGTTWHTLAGA